MLGAVKALRWSAGAIEAESLTSLTVSRRAAATVSEVLGDFGASVTLNGGNLAAKKPAAGAVSIAHDLAASIWQVNGAMTSIAVTHTAMNSIVRASGSITSITLGSGDGSDFLAGDTNDQELDPNQIVAADIDPTGLAMIGSVTIKGWTVPAGTAIPDFLTDSSFLAPNLGTVSLLNGTPGTGHWTCGSRR